MSETLSFNDVKGRLGVSESTLMDMILFEKFPMKKTDDSVYEMSEQEFQGWSGSTVKKVVDDNSQHSNRQVAERKPKKKYRK